FFQAEDGIRDKLVTGVQTCALPIFPGAILSQIPPHRDVPGRRAYAARRESDDVCALSSTTRPIALTTAGSNCVPAHLSSSSSASARLRVLRDGGAVVTRVSA